MSNDILIGNELGPEFDKGNIQSGKVRLKLGQGLAIAPDGTISRTGVSTTIYHERYAGRTNIGGLTVDFTRNSTMTRTGTGVWEVRFTGGVHPDGDNYSLGLWVGESGTDRDVAKISIIDGSLTSSGFDVQLTADDNGATADILEDNSWGWTVSAPINVLSV